MPNITVRTWTLPGLSDKVPTYSISSIHVRKYFSVMRTACVWIYFPVPIYGPQTSVTNHEVNSLLLNWTAIPSQEARGIVVGYRIYYRPYYSNQTFNVVQTNASTFKIKLDNLEEATLYAIMVGGLTLKGEGLYCFLSESTCKYWLSPSVTVSVTLFVCVPLSVCVLVCLFQSLFLEV